MGRIVIDSRVLAGKPIIEGTRISVEFVVKLLASGMTIEEIIKEYPHLKKQDILAALAYAANKLSREEVYQIK